MSVSRLAIRRTVDSTIALKSIGKYPENNDLLSGQVENTLYAAADDKTRNLLPSFDSYIAQEKAVLQQSGDQKQQGLLKTKLVIANELGRLRKILKKTRLNEGNNAGIIRMLDAIESADYAIESYKPPKHTPQESQDQDIPLTPNGSNRDTAKMIQTIKSLEKSTPKSSTTPQISTSSAELLAKLLLGGIAGVCLYTVLAFIINLLAFKFSVPFILGSTLFIACIILIHRVAAPEANNTPLVEALDKINRKWWYLSSMPGAIAAFMETNPKTSIAYACTLTGSILFLLLTTIGTSLVTQAGGLLGIGYYGALYIIIPVMAFLPVQAGLSIYYTTHPDQKPASKKQQTPEAFKPFSTNPIARLWQAIDTFLNKFYLIGMQSPIAMLLFTIIYIGLTVQIMVPFLPANMAAIVQYLLTGISNPAAGLLFAAVCTGWFIGLFILQTADILTRGDESGTVKSIDYMQKNPIDTALFLAILILSAQIVAGTPMAHICGRWLILGLITINFKPLLAIADFMMNPRKSTIGSSLALPFMPVKLILYPGEALYYLFKLVTQVTAGILKHFLLHVPLVLIRALFDITTAIVSWFSKEAAEKVIDANIDSYLFVRNTVLQVKHAGKNLQYTIRPYVRLANTVLSATIGTYCCFISITGINYFILGHLPHTLFLPGVQSTITFITTFLSLPTAMTLFAIIGSYFTILSAHQLFSPKDMQSTENRNFTMITQVIMTGLLITCALLITLQPPLYSVAVIGTVAATIMMTIMSSFYTFHIYKNVENTEGTPPEKSYSFTTHYGLSSLLLPDQSHVETPSPTQANK